MPANFYMADNRFQARICVIQDGCYYSKLTPIDSTLEVGWATQLKSVKFKIESWILRISCPSIFKMPDIQVLLSPCTTEFKMVTIQILRIPCTRKFKTATIWFYSGSSANSGLKSMHFRVATIWFYTDLCKPRSWKLWNSKWLPSKSHELHSPQIKIVHK